MVTNQQVRRLRKLMSKGYTLYMSAAKASVDEKTARKYMNAEKLPSETSSPHSWRTREDPFSDIWEQVRQHLKVNPGLEGQTS